ncbi:MAG: hypothetical protein JKX78_02855 [Alteromonadaceae bacterium]|nr:hypothetical protein [Alteromonadaceae bacterium]
MIETPKHFLDIDYEARSEADITKVGAMKYAEHPSTEIMMVSFSYNGRTVYNWNPFTSKASAPHVLLALIKCGWIIRAHNSEFEYWMTNLVATRQFGWPEVPVEQFYDTMAMSCAMAFPASLEKAGAAIKAKVTKDPGGMILINWFSKPQANGKGFRCPHDHPEKFQKFIDYCDDDVATQMAIADKSELLSPFEHEVFLMTERMNVLGLPIDRDLVSAALELVGQFQVYANKKAKRLAGPDCGFEFLTQTAKVKDWLNANGCDIPNMQKDVIAEWLGDSMKTIPKKCRTILQLRTQAAKASTAKYVRMADGVDNNGWLHGFLKYHIARTGRWGGRGVQIQNFPKPGKTVYHLDWEEVIKVVKKRKLKLLKKYGDPMEVLAGCLRGAICAPKGYKFVSADYSQIEARFIFWLADDPVGLEDFGGDGKVYEGMAAQIYGVKKEMIKKGSFERDIGKSTVLGAGFGMGPRKFVTSCWDQGGIVVSPALGKKAIEGYKERYKMVPILWEKVEKAAIRAVLVPMKRFTYKKISYQKRGKHLYCRLPSGRELCYPFARVRTVKTRFGPQPKLFYDGHCSYTNKWRELDTWGGKLTENFTQAAARDYMAVGLMNCEASGVYKTLFTVHDEGVSLAKIGEGSVKEYEDLMCVSPKWAKGCPIEAEGWEGKRYRK